MYLFGGLWMVARLMEALSASHGIGAKALWVMACWLWIPLGMLSLYGWLAAPGQAPMLLVLRVFRRDAQVQVLFDDVVEAWRYSGPTCLIAGTDLALRTLEPDEIGQDIIDVGKELRKRISLFGDVIRGGNKHLEDPGHTHR